jgi:hypothetical protein
MKILEALYILLLTVPTLSGFVLLALFVFLFRLGMSSGFKGSQRRGLSFASSLANGWARGWLLLIVPIILWLVMIYLMFFLSGADTGLDLEIEAIIFFFGGIAVLILAPGMIISRRILAQYPAVSLRTATLTAAVWVIIFPVCLSIFNILLAVLLTPIKDLRSPFGFSTIARYFEIFFLTLTSGWDNFWKVIASSWSGQFGWGLFGRAAFFVLASLSISKAAGKRITIRLLRGVIEPTTPPAGKVDLRAWLKRILLLEYLPPAWVAWLQRPSLSRARVGWVLAWVLLSWGAIAIFEFPRGASLGVTLGHAACFGFVTALAVPAAAGAVAALLRDSDAPRRQTLELIEDWFFAGIQGWSFGLFAAFIMVFIYELTQASIAYEITQTLSSVTRTVITSEIFWLTSAALALIVAQSREKVSARKTAPDFAGFSETSLPVSEGTKPMKPLSLIRGAIGWGLVWVLFTWVIAGRFGIYGGYSKGDLLWLSVRFCLLIASVVSICAGLSAALSMRESATTWPQTWKMAWSWVYSGFIGWGIGLPLCWIVVIAYQQVFNLPLSSKIDSEGLIRVGTEWNDAAQIFLLVGGIIALIVGFMILLRNVGNKNARHEHG